MSKRFEYCIQQMPDTPLHKLDTIAATLNTLGDDGWEMVGVAGWLAYFKREYSGPPPEGYGGHHADVPLRDERAADGDAE